MMLHSPDPIVDDTADNRTVALCISNLSKAYRIYERSQDRLLQSVWGSRKQLYREFRALDGVSFDVYRGETLGIIGLNGSGKSTLLQLVAGTLTPTEGEVRVNGRISALLELGAGFNAEFTGSENILLAASIAGLTAGEIKQRHDRIAEYAGIGSFIDQPVKTYSSGMYVRLAFAVAISVEPEVLIIDEALAVGDMEFQAKCMVTLKHLQKLGTTILLVSHDIGAVSALCHRTLYLRQGRLLELGPTGEVVARYIREAQEASNREITASTADPEGHACSTAESGGTINLPAPQNERFACFAEKAAYCRSGAGDVRVIYAEMVDDNGLPAHSVKFGQQVTIRIIVEAVRTCTFSVNYKICDKNRIPVIGADFLMQGQELLTLAPEQQAEIAYRTSLPLTDGKYSLRISLTHPINAHQQALFFDIVEIAHVFEVLPNATAKFWTQIYLPNVLDIKVS
jgi:lipopolysaccharide transport system ATP-binding protein